MNNTLNQTRQETIIIHLFKETGKFYEERQINLLINYLTDNCVNMNAIKLAIENLIKEGKIPKSYIIYTTHKDGYPILIL